MQQFRYRPLNTTICASEVRLVRIEKSVDYEPGFFLTLRHATLEEKPHFNALSYTWDQDLVWMPRNRSPLDDLFSILDRRGSISESVRCRIVIRDGSHEGWLLVRQNLALFLSAACRSNQTWEMEWIWIDQICINQDNHAEKCHQVNQMDRVYSSAVSTIIWPGFAAWQRVSEADAMAFPEMTAASEIVSAAHTVGSRSCRCSHREFGRRELVNIRLTPIQLRKLDDKLSFPSGSAMRLFENVSACVLNGLCSVDYWDRLWIIQEVVLAPRVRIIIQDKLWALEDLLGALKLWLNELGTSVSRTGSNLYDVQHRIDVLLHHRQQLRRGNDWSDVLYLAGDTRCLVPRDKIYGVMGLLDAGLRVHADYEISHRAILKDILQKQIAFLGDRVDDPWVILGKMLYCWDLLDLESIRPVGQVITFHDDPSGKNDTMERRRILKHNVCLVLEELGVQILDDSGPARWVDDVWPVESGSVRRAADEAKRLKHANQDHNSIWDFSYYPWLGQVRE